LNPWEIHDGFIDLLDVSCIITYSILRCSNGPKNAKSLQFYASV